MTPGLNSFGLPPDGPAWAALAVAAGAVLVALLPQATRERVLRPLLAHPRRAVLLLALTAALLSWGYVLHYLRGGPRIIDATSYFLEARAMAEGKLVFSTPLPSGSFRGRFLVTPPGSTALGVLFPPGYPAVLALGFLFGAPLAIGPVLAAALVVVTYALTLRLFQRPKLALLAAALSVSCAALRYHTADTMAHGLSALLLAAALLFALQGNRWLLLAGLSAGWLCATRPVTGGVALVLVTGIVLRDRQLRRLPWVLLGSSVGLLLLLAHQHATTGQLLGSSQLRYYSLSDGPPGCFRYGFGAGVGCLFEHGDFVRARLPQGFDLLAALGTTGRRLLHHGLDVANAEPLALMVPFAVARALRDARLRIPVAGVVLVLLAYVPFYFDATYPGGGARLYADALPLEHALVAWGVYELSLARFALPLALAGFALRGSYAHVALAEREGGRPMFEPEVLARAGVDQGLVFVHTDHGFNLGFDPDARRLQVARRRDDAHDWVLWESLGRPPVYRYDFDPFTPSSNPRIEPLTLRPPATPRFEAEAEWPPLAVSKGWAMPVFAGCASGGRALSLRSSGEGSAITVELPLLRAEQFRLRAGWAAESDTEGRTIVLGTETRAPHKKGECWSTEGPTLALGPGSHRVSVATHSPGVALDYLEVVATGPR